MRRQNGTLRDSVYFLDHRERVARGESEPRVEARLTRRRDRRALFVLRVALDDAAPARRRPARHRGLSLALSSALDASARDGEPAPAATRAMFVTPKPLDTALAWTRRRKPLGEEGVLRVGRLPGLRGRAAGRRSRHRRARRRRRTSTTASASTGGRHRSSRCSPTGARSPWPPVRRHRRGTRRCARSAFRTSTRRRTSAAPQAAQGVRRRGQAPVRPRRVAKGVHGARTA